MNRLAALVLSLVALSACESPTDASVSTPHGDTAGEHAGMDHDTGAENSYSDVGFLDGMIHHHEMAVEMAETVQERGQNPDVKGLAEEVIRTQSAEIDTMRAWGSRWFADAPASGVMTGDDTARMGMAVPMDSLTAAADPDRAFLAMMIPHHAGAIVMASEAEARTERPEVRALARQIVQAQAREVGQMQAWLDEGERNP